MTQPPLGRGNIREREANACYGSRRFVNELDRLEFLFRHYREYTEPLAVFEERAPDERNARGSGRVRATERNPRTWILNHTQIRPIRVYHRGCCNPFVKRNKPATIMNSEGQEIYIGDLARTDNAIGGEER